MPVLECKMCGGKFDADAAGARVVTCKFCGTTTEPHIARPGIPQGIFGDLLRQGRFALEVGQFSQGAEYFQRALAHDANCAEAYAGLYLAREKMRREEEIPLQYNRLLAAQTKYSKIDPARTPFDDAYLQNALRCAQGEYRVYLESLLAQAQADAQRRYTTLLYNEAQKYKALGRSDAYREARALYTKLGAYKDAPAQADECAALYEQALQNEKQTQAEEIARREQETAAFKQSTEKENAPKPPTLRQRLAKAKKLVTIIAIVACILLLVVPYVFASVMPSVNYNRGVRLYEQGQYEQAIELLRKAQSNSDAKALVIQVRAEYAALLLEQGDIAEGAEQVYQMGSKSTLYFSDSEHVALALFLLENGDDLKAAWLLEHTNVSALSLYGRMVQNGPEQALALGDRITLGSYINEHGSQQRLEWYVIDKDENGVVLLSQYILDALALDENDGTEWKDSSLRTWLNGEWLDTALSKQEQSLLLPFLYNYGLKQDYVALPPYSYIADNSDEDWATGKNCPGSKFENKLNSYWLFDNSADGQYYTILYRGEKTFATAPSSDANGVRPILYLPYSDTLTVSLLENWMSFENSDTGTS